MKNQNALVGYTGFVGGNLLKQCDFSALYNSKNIADIAGRSFDLLVFSGAQAKKWWANQNPEEDWAGIEKALKPLRTVSAEHLVLISTIDVLPVTTNVDEDFDCHSMENHVYGTNRLRLEDALRGQFNNITIIRLPGLFGPGLKKNVIYDLLNNNELDKINPESAFQYYDLRRLWKDIERTREAGIELMHFATEPVGTAEILERYFPKCEVGANKYPTAKYDFRTKHSEVFGRSDEYMFSRSEILDQLGSYLKQVRRA